MPERLNRLSLSTHRKTVAGSIAESILQFVFKLIIPLFINGDQSPVVVRSPKHAERIARINKRLHILSAGPRVYHPVFIL